MKRNRLIHGGWLDDALFIWGEEAPSSTYQKIIRFQYPFTVSAFDLKLQLFRHDRHSFYGTFIAEKEVLIDVPLYRKQFVSLAGSITVYEAEESAELYSFPLEGIVIPIEQLPDYFKTLRRFEADPSIRLAPDFKRALELISSIQTAIIAGKFRPHPKGYWELSEFPYETWIDLLPASAFAIRDKATATEPIERLKNIVTALSDRFIRHLVCQRDVAPFFSAWLKSVDSTWRLHLERLKENEVIDTDMEPASFLESVGAIKKMPFLTSLALKEPKREDGEWLVTVCMIDRDNRSLVVAMDELERGLHPWRENPIAQLKRDLERARDAIPILQPLRLSSPTLALTAEEAYSLFTEYDERLKQLGIELIVPKWMLETKTIHVTLAFKHGRHAISTHTPILNWQSVADFSYRVALGTEVIDEKQFTRFVDENRPFLFIDGQWIAWDRAYAHKLRAALEGLRQKSYYELWRFYQLNDDRFSITSSDAFDEAVRKLYFKSPPLIAEPKTFAGKLRRYQLEGTSWLVHLRTIGFGGCLADDMGLGKTVQTLAYVLHVLERQRTDERAPFLLICPTSVLDNWRNECKTFAPTLKLYVHHGQSRLDERKAYVLREYDIVMTTYQSALRDVALLKTIAWNGLILDEAQQIKNVATKQRRAIKTLRALHRIALTGTPIENDLRELWSIMDVLNPTFLGTYEQFQKNFIIPIEKDRDQTALQKLQTLIHPFILRRKKSDRSLQLPLPKKNETIHRVHLSLEQAALYQAVVDEIRTHIEVVSHLERRAFILKSLTKLKQICNHPAHYLKAASVDRYESGKWKKLLEITDEIVRKKEKALIFTQYKEMGTLMARALARRYRCEIPFLHGSLTRKKRQQLIEMFQNEASLPIFILSLKAGGVGLNLTVATNVIHYDRWWNPAVENQATDRVYRIGQTKDVHVHKLITVGTLEERIDALLERKQKLADDILMTDANRLTELTDEELFSLIRLSSGKDGKS